MRAVVGALVGLVAATAIVAVLGSVLAQRAYLAALVAGLAAGLIMRIMASGAGSVYARGAMAAVMTAAATVAGPIAARQWFVLQNESIAPPPKSVVAEETSEDSDGDETSTVAVEAPPVALASDRLPTGIPTAGGTSQDTVPLELITMAIGCLLAYQLGKGVPATTPEAEEAAEPDESAPPTDEAAEPGEDSPPEGE